MNKSFVYVWSSLGKKVFAALSGLVLIGFLISHLLGNLLLFLPDGDMYNEYAHTLLSMGKVLIAVELVLLSFFGLHVLAGAWVTLSNRSARSQGYEVSGNAGGASHKTFASKTMIWSGIILLIFIVVHLLNFKFGDIPQTTVKGVEMHDFHTMVIAFFQNPLAVLFYVVTMSFIFFHVRHGFWSAFQSLGVNNLIVSRALYLLALLLALALVGGYLSIPIYIYFFTTV